MTERLTYDVTEAAAVLGVATTTLYGWLQENGIESIKIGKRRVVPKEAIHKMLGIASVSGPDPVEFASRARIAELELKINAYKEELNQLRKRFPENVVFRRRRSA